MKAFFLVVDDHFQLVRLIIRLATRAFVQEGVLVEVLQAASGHEALGLAREALAREPDSMWMLITDYDMPGMSGSQLVDELNTLLGERLLVRLLITGLPDEERRRELEAKQCAFEGKPFDIAKLDPYFRRFANSLKPPTSE